MLGAVLVTAVHDAGLGLASFLALGNRSDVSGNDLLQYWETDESTEVVGMYIESFGNPRNFSRLARRLARVKPVVAVKAGHADGVDADATEDALLRQTGVVRVPTLDALVDTARVLIDEPLPAGRRVAVLGNAGGSLAIAADAARHAQLEVAELAPATVLGAGAPAHPDPAPGIVDLGPHAGAHDVEQAVAALVSDPGVDALIVIYAAGLGATVDEAVRAIEVGRKVRPDVPVVVCAYGPRPRRRADVPVYDAIDAAADALGRVATYAAWRAEPAGEVVPLEEDRLVAARRLVQEHLDRGLGDLGDLAALSLLDAAGLPVLRTEPTASSEEAQQAAASIGYPVVLKAARRGPTAKTAAAGLAIDLEDADAVAGAWARMATGLGDDMIPVLVQPMVPPGVDVAVRIRHHPTVGPVLSIGPGGAAAAFDRPTDVRVLPLTDLDARRLVATSRLADALDDADRAALEATLLRVAALAEEVPEVGDVTMNPVILHRGEAVVTQAHATLAAVDIDPLPPVRRA
jgi:acyl-CoA synthetase (NDP forming)